MNWNSDPRKLQCSNVAQVFLPAFLDFIFFPISSNYNSETFWTWKNTHLLPEMFYIKRAKEAKQLNWPMRAFSASFVVSTGCVKGRCMKEWNMWVPWLEFVPHNCCLLERFFSYNKYLVSTWKKCFQGTRYYLVHTVSTEAHSVCHQKADKQDILDAVSHWCWILLQQVVSTWI